MGKMEDNAWSLPILACSSIETGNQEIVINTIDAYFDYLAKNELLAPKRLANAIHWLKTQIVNKFIPHLQLELLNLPEIKKSLKEIEAGERSPFQILPDLMTQIEIGVKFK